MTDSSLTNAEKQSSFKEGAEWMYRRRREPTHQGDAHEEALRRYPDPKPEPKVAVMENGHQFSVRGNAVMFRANESFEWMCSRFAIDDLIALGSLAHEYVTNHRETKTNG